MHDLIAAPPLADVAELTVDGILAVTCEFCNRNYHFDGQALNTGTEAPR